MDPELQDTFRRTFRAFKRQASRLRDGLEGISEFPDARIAWEAGGQAESSFDEIPSLVRLAALLRPFMVKDSDIELRLIWSAIQASDLSIYSEHSQAIDQAFIAVDRPEVPISLNGRALTTRDTYHAYAEGKLFAADPDAAQVLRQLMIEPLRALALHSFYDACVRYSYLALMMLDVILDIEKRHSGFKRTSCGDNRCIYCLDREGQFTSEEHVIPEALGQDELVLTECVCDACNNSLSALDQYLVEFEPIALLRVSYLPLTKKGKFPTADLREFRLEKTKPREVRLISKGDEGWLTVTEQEDGQTRFSIKTQGRKPVDAQMLGRALFKIGLGLVAHDHGADYACDSRFDAARSFIRGDSGMPNSLLILNRVTPSPRIAAMWYPEPNATPVAIEIYGIWFGFNLEPHDFSPPDGFPVGLFEVLSLDT
ncbi:MAG: HNH endonuclease [Coriobacteriia bacterium]|nr:HNH endonuclease [Coriobacteriia bacterium]